MKLLVRCGLGLTALLMLLLAGGTTRGAPGYSAAATVEPGGLWIVRGPAGSAFTVRLFGITTRAYPVEGQTVALVPISGRTKAGSYTAVVRSDSGETSSLPVKVRAKRFVTQHIKMPKSKTGLQSPAILKKERQILYGALAKTGPEPMWTGPFRLPLQARVSSDYGKMRYVNGKFWSQHSGVDLAAGTGVRVLAPNRGRVLLTQKLWMRGNTLLLDHGLGLVSAFNHLSGFLVKPGDVVEKGQPIAKVGATGFVTGPHLHWEVRAGQVPVNPWPLIRQGVGL